MPITYTNAHGAPIANPGFWDHIVNGSRGINPLARTALTAGVSQIPIVGAPVAAGYNIGRLINSVYRAFTPKTYDAAGIPYLNSEGIAYLNGTAPSVPSSAPPPTPAAPPPEAAQPQAAPDWRQVIASHLNNIGFNLARPAFGSTSFQLNNPGSAIGPGVFSTTGTGYYPNGTVGSHSGVDTGLPAWAAGLMSDVRAKNII